MVAGFAQGVQMYKQAHNAPRPWVLFIIEDDERNVCDQKLLEFLLQRDHGIFSMRKTLLQVYQEA